jgi:hypothetical protein
MVTRVAIIRVRYVKDMLKASIFRNRQAFVMSNLLVTFLHVCLLNAGDGKWLLGVVTSKRLQE